MILITMSYNLVISAVFAYMDNVGKGREHDCMDAGGRATQGAVAEDAEAWRELFFVDGH